jgi:glycosyltransferase involved in cell wall biosynthesis
LSFFGAGRDEAFVKQAANFYGLGDRVRFPGYIRDVEAIWREHHLMVLPSRGEGLPLAVLEAMMCGRPAVATDAGGNSELVEEGVTGFLAQAATPLSLGEALERAWAARGQWEVLGQEAHRRARQIAGANPAGQLLKYVVASASHTSR